MRLYFAVRPDELSAEEFAPRGAYALTRALAAALPDEDEEGLETSAFLAAADAAVELAGPAGRRVVIAGDGSAEPLSGSDEHPGAVRMTAAMRWGDVAALFVDEPEAAQDVLEAARVLAEGEENEIALERAADRDLLWYDPSERAAVIAELGL